MKNEERRMLLRSLSDAEYEDIINVCSSYPLITAEVEAKVIDIDKEDMLVITPESRVTAVLKAKRRPMGELFGDTSAVLPVTDEVAEPEAEEETSSKPVWQRKNKKSKTAKKPVKKPVKKPTKKKVETPEPVVEEKVTSKKKAKSENGVEDVDMDSEEGSGNEAANDQSEESGSESDVDFTVSKEDADADDEEDDDDDLASDVLNKQDLIQLLEGTTKDSHVVHAPHFPQAIQEKWWCYVVSRKTNTMVCPPTIMSSLKDEEEIELKFTAPNKPGTYFYTAHMRSAVYLTDFDLFIHFKIEVKEAEEVDLTRHWEYSEDEGAGESDYETDESDEEDHSS